MNYKEYGELLIKIGKSLTEKSTDGMENKRDSTKHVLFGNLKAFQEVIRLLDKEHPPNTLIEEHKAIRESFEQLIRLTEENIIGYDSDYLAKEFDKQVKNISLISTDIMKKVIYLSLD